MVVAGEREEAVVGEKRARCLAMPPPRTEKCRALHSRRVVESIALKSTGCMSDLMKASKKTQLNLRRLSRTAFLPEDDVKDVPERYSEVLPLFVLRRHHVGGGVDEERRMVERRAGWIGV